MHKVNCSGANCVPVVNCLQTIDVVLAVSMVPVLSVIVGPWTMETSISSSLCVLVGDCEKCIGLP